MLLSSHSLAEVQRVADRVAIIRDGRLVVTDTVEALRARAPRVMSSAVPERRRRGAVPPAARVSSAWSRTAADLDLHVRGEIGPVLEAALAQHVVDLTAHHADLEELFLAYYRDPDEGSTS